MNSPGTPGPSGTESESTGLITPAASAGESLRMPVDPFSVVPTVLSTGTMAAAKREKRVRSGRRLSQRLGKLQTCWRQSADSAASSLALLRPQSRRSDDG